MNKQESVKGPARPDPLREDTRDARTRYADIIDRSHHVSAKRPQMDRLSRAAQFSPFAALTGYDDLIRESERDVGSRVELDEDRKAQLNDWLARLLAERPIPEAAFTYFVPDEKKEGGEYVTASGRIARYDQQERTLLLEDGTVIPAREITAIDEVNDVQPS